MSYQCDADGTVVNTLDQDRKPTKCVCYFSLIKSVCYLLPQGADSGQISEETWNFLHSVHGGGPLVTVRPNVSHPELEASSQSKEKI
jgi:hypothetical protein